jgi:Cofactor assembly of complex C subunit B
VNTPTVLSPLILTLLLMVGLFFFIRASVKDRTEQVKLLWQEPEESVLNKLQQYFEQRAYRITTVDPTLNRVTFEGFVRPSWFLAVFLSFLAAVGLLCLALVLSLLYPSSGNFFLALTLLAPAAGIFYWQKAGRREQVSLQVETISAPQPQKSIITITAHRDELFQLQQAFPTVLKAEENA